MTFVHYPLISPGPHSGTSIPGPTLTFQAGYVGPVPVARCTYCYVVRSDLTERDLILLTSGGLGFDNDIRREPKGLLRQFA